MIPISIVRRIAREVDSLLDSGDEHTIYMELISLKEKVWELENEK